MVNKPLYNELLSWGGSMLGEDRLTLHHHPTKLFTLTDPLGSAHSKLSSKPCTCAGHPAREPPFGGFSQPAVNSRYNLPKRNIYKTQKHYSMATHTFFIFVRLAATHISLGNPYRRDRYNNNSASKSRPKLTEQSGAGWLVEGFI